MTQNARIVSLQVGTPAEHGTPGAADPLKRPWRSGFAKKPVQTPVQLERTNFVGDGQADLEHHGGPEKAVCVYPAAHFPYWFERLGKPFGPGAFGENLSVSGLVEKDVCVGDVFRIGNSLVQVTQPRSPCWKLARFHGEKHLALWVQETGFCGWYFSVVETGQVQAGDHLELVERPFPQW